MTRFFLLLTLIPSTALAGRMGPWLDEPAVSDTGVAEPALPSCEGVRLQGGVQLPERPELYTRWNPRTAWGTPYLIDTLVTAAEQVAAEMPYVDPIAVGDLSSQRGGPLHGHLTHDEGRDADIGLFLKDGRQATNGTFVDAWPRTFDVEATWALIRALLETERIHHILMDESLIRVMRTWLVEEGILEAEAVQRMFPRGGGFGRTGVVIHAPGHRNHLHVRVRCESP